MDLLLDERGSTAAADERKLPVLFHLLDVSRPRAPKAAVQPTDLATSRGAVAATAELDLELSLAPLPPAPISPLIFPAVDVPVANSPLPAAPIECATEPAAETSPTDVPEPLPVAITATSESSAPQASPSLEDQPVSLPSARQTFRRPRAKSADDWFAAHGKFIAVAFVLALVGTVYFARTSRRPDKIQDETLRPVAPLIELATAPAESKPDFGSAPAANAPSLTTEMAATPAPATVELHLPAPPAAQVATANDTSPRGDSLFIFPATKPPEERVAARPEVSPSQFPPTAPATSPVTATMPPAYPVTSSQPLTPTAAPPWNAASRYPQTPAPPLAGVNPAAAYQPMSPPAAPPLPAVQPAPGYGSTFNQSPDNVASGPRYERTGSGNY